MIHPIIINFGLLLVILVLLLGGCTSTKSMASLNDKKYFKEPPSIVVKDDHYFLRFVYSDSEDAWRYFMTTWSEIEDNKLVFCLPATSSSGNLKGETQFEAISKTQKVELIKAGKVYWREPGGMLTALAVEPLKKEEEATVLDRYLKRVKH